MSDDLMQIRADLAASQAEATQYAMAVGTATQEIHCLRHELDEARADNAQLRRRLIEMQNDKLVRTPEEVVYDQMRRYGLPDPTAMAVARGYQSAFDERVGQFLAYELALKAQVEKNRRAVDRLLAEEAT